MDKRVIASCNNPIQFNLIRFDSIHESNLGIVMSGQQQVSIANKVNNPQVSAICSWQIDLFLADFQGLPCSHQTPS